MIKTYSSECGNLCLAFIDKDIILRSDGSMLSADDIDFLKDKSQYFDFFTEPEYKICVLGISNRDSIPSGFATESIRLFSYRQDEETVIRISRAKALLSWRQNTKFCSVCGALLTEHETLTAMQCTKCNTIVFPRIEPCIIVLVKRGREILLARHVQRNQEIYACIAGFMEAGETAEQAVIREVKEETGITVRNIKYFGTQSWPFPSQLMIGFTAEYESGELTLQEDEIADAAWFSPENCPATPPPGSIAYQLIDYVQRSLL